jgi:hypothetical protein
VRAIRQAIATAHRGRPLLFWLACFHVGLAFVFAVAAPFDNRVVTGVDPWIKPFKFASSIAIYTFTLALLLDSLSAKRFARWISAGVTLSMLVEIVLIAGQAARGVSSHFNESTPLDFAIFGVMGVAIVFNVLHDVLVAAKFFRSAPRLPAATLWGIRLGLAIFIAGSLEGFAMVARLSHAVGVPDGGPGLPLINWSTQGGDLRIAHFLALHSLQALPLLGYAIDRWWGAILKRRGAFTMQVAAGAYALAVAGLMTLALAGIPLIRL